MAALPLSRNKPEVSSLPKGWRGEHDPAGSMFRGPQTFELYGYWPLDLPEAAAQTVQGAAPQTKAAPLLSPISGATDSLQENELDELECAGDVFDDKVLKLVTKDYVMPSHDPVAVCIIARQAVDWLRDHRCDDIAPYVADIEKSVAGLRRDLQGPSLIDRAIEKALGSVI